ncbi:MAG: sensor histidine kinase, partial [Bacilli bacterium]|nr:sensor histidine kinase [Bacilli bacterium]
MKFIDFLKDNVISILIYIITLALASFILVAFKLDYSVIIVLNILFITSGILIISLKYYHKNKFYKIFFHNLERLSKKYLILETLPDASTYEEKLFVNALYDINKSMIENINLYESNIIEFKEFVEIWIHEVKIPISSMVLKCHNHKEKYDKSFFSLIRRLDNIIDEILYYVRSENT